MELERPDAGKPCVFRSGLKPGSVAGGGLLLAAGCVFGLIDGLILAPYIIDSVWLAIPVAALGAVVVICLAAGILLLLRARRYKAVTQEVLTNGQIAEGILLSAVRAGRRSGKTGIQTYDYEITYAYRDASGTRKCDSVTFSSGDRKTYTTGESLCVIFYKGVALILESYTDLSGRVFAAKNGKVDEGETPPNASPR